MEEDYNCIYACPPGPIEKILSEKRINHVKVKSFTPKELNKVIEQWKPDVIHAHDFRASILSTLIKKKTFKISHIHQNPLWLNKINLYSISYLISTLFIDKIVTVSDEVFKDMPFKKLVQSKSKTITNFVDDKVIKL